MTAVAIAIASSVMLAQRLLEALDAPDELMLPGSALQAGDQSKSDVFAEQATVAGEPLARYRATLERPLFETDRRPWSPKAVIPPVRDPEPNPKQNIQPSEFPAELRLIGVHISGRTRRALFRTGAGTSASWIGIGEEVSGWVVTEIERNHVALASRSTSRRLPLYVEK